MTVKADTRELKRFQKDLIQLNRKGIPYAVKNSLNSLAFDARSEWQEGLRREFTLRNKFTESSIRVEKARGLDMRSMESRVGSIAPYMENQEEGGERRKGGKYGPPIPTNDARTGKSPKKLVARPNKMSRINLAAKGLSKFKTKRQKIAVAASMAKRGGSKYAMIPLKNSEGIYKLSGGKRKLRMRMVWSMAKRSVFVPPNPTMKPAVTRAESRFLGHYKDALKSQLKLAQTWKR